MTTTDMDLMAMLRAVDPINTDTETDVAARLGGVRRVIDARRVSAATVRDTRSSYRRWQVVAVLAGAAVLSPVAVVSLVPGMAARVGMSWMAIVGTEVADRLACDGGGYASPIPPRDAPLRLWPGELPAGWTVQTVFARRTEGSAGCTAPSLTVAETAPDGVVTGTVRVVGPQRRIAMPGDPDLNPDRVAGRPAVEVVYPGMERPDFRRWIVRGPEDREWEVLSIGFEGGRDREVVDQLAFTATHASYTQSPGSELTVVHERTGPPYPDTSDGLEWYVTLRDDRGRKRAIYVRDTSLDIPIVSEVVPGARVYQLDGRPAMADTPATEGVQSLTIEPAPGVLATMPIRGDLDVVERVLTSLVNLDKGDPRLTEYALPERYEK